VERSFRRRIRNETYIHDRNRNWRLFSLKGVLVLPVGSEIELPYGPQSAIVTGVRLLSVSGVHQVCLDVEVPQEYYTERGEEAEAEQMKTFQK